MRQAWTISSLLDKSSFGWLDQIAGSLQQTAADIFSSSEAAQQAKNWLNGTPLRHRIHPALVTVPIGAWTSAVVLDWLDSVSPETKAGGFRRGADVCVALGILGVLPSAATGIADWVDTYGHPRRVGTAHALANSVALTLYMLSLGLRATGSRSTARKMAYLGWSSTMLGGVLGGELVYTLGVNVPYMLQPRPPLEWTDVLASEDLPSDQPVLVEVGSVPVMLLRQAETIYAVEAWCPHAGGGLHEGEFANGTVRCPWHGARFRLNDGAPLEGPASVPLRTFAVSETNGRIAVQPGFEGADWPSPPPLPPERH